MIFLRRKEVHSMPQNYTPGFKKKVVRLRLEEGRTINSITMEYGISRESVRRWCNGSQKEYQAQSLQTPSSVNGAEIMKDNLRLRRELAEKEKELLFLKKAAAFSAKEIDQKLIGLSNCITEDSAFADCWSGLVSARMPITTIGNTERRIIMQKGSGKSADQRDLPYA